MRVRCWISCGELWLYMILWSCGGCSNILLSRKRTDETIRVTFSRVLKGGGGGKRSGGKRSDELCAESIQ